MSSGKIASFIADAEAVIAALRVVQAVEGGESVSADDRAEALRVLEDSTDGRGYLVVRTMLADYTDLLGFGVEDRIHPDAPDGSPVNDLREVA